MMICPLIAVYVVAINYWNESRKVVKEAHLALNLEPSKRMLELSAVLASYLGVIVQVVV